VAIVTYAPAAAAARTVVRSSPEAPPVMNTDLLESSRA
jgi:hypothetical protein